MRKTTLPQLHQMPPWLALAPWVVVVCTLFLAALVLTMEYRGAPKETEISTTIYLERGASLMEAYEATLRAGRGWSDDDLQNVMNNLATTPDVYYVAVTDRSGQVLASSNPDLMGEKMLSSRQVSLLVPQSRVQGAIQDIPEDRRGNGPSSIFIVYKRIIDPQNEARLREHGHGRMMGMHRPGMMRRPENTGELVLMVGYDLNALLSAQDADMRRALTHWAILAFLGLVGLLTLVLVKNYQRSRTLVQETTAFSFALIDALPLGLLALNSQGVITTLNPEGERITGLQGRQIVGKALIEVLPDVWNMLNARHLFDGASPGKEQEFQCQVGENKKIPLAITIAPIVTADGFQAGHTIVMRDLEEIRRLQAELRRQDRLAALGSMAAGVAHEIRNPLGAIKGLARFFQESSPVQSEEARVAEIMTQEVLRLDKVVGDLLELARPDHLHLSPVDLEQFFDRIQEMTKADREAAHISYYCDLSSSLSKVVMDMDRMTQVVLNLALNAIQAMPHGGELHMSADIICQAEQDKPQWLLLEVRDTGEGITPEHLQNIFSPYFTTKAQGTGLGLALVLKIVEAHEGEIEVHSVPGQGTCFSIRLPFAAPSEKPDPEKARG